MFLHMLTPDQQDAFIKIAQYMLQADGPECDPREEALLHAAMREMQLDERPLSPANIDEVLRSLAVVEDLVSRRVFVLELVGMAVADRIVHPGEEQVIASVAEALAVRAADVEAFKSLAHKMYDLADEARRLVATG